MVIKYNKIFQKTFCLLHIFCIQLLVKIRESEKMTRNNEMFSFQQSWKKEIQEHMQHMQRCTKTNTRFEADLIRRREDELRHAQDIREHYERKLERTNNLYLELNAVLLQLELRERDVIK